MIDVTTIYTDKVEAVDRNPEISVEIDWDLDFTFDDETDYLDFLEIERGMEEPLGGVYLAQCDFRLIDPDGRFTPDDS